MNKPKPPTVDPEDVPEVVTFLEAQDKLADWKATYSGAYDELKEIVDQYNTALENADKSVRAREIICGPFVLSTYSTIMDANALYDAVGRDDFLKLGGSVQTVQQYDIDKKAFEGFVAQKKVHPDVVKKVVTFRPSYKKPGKIEIP